MLNEEIRILCCISELRWAYRNNPRIEKMDTKWIENTVKMIKEGRAKVCVFDSLANVYIAMFEKELRRRGV